MNGIFITVRTNSSRLSNKALLKLCNGVTTIEYLINRIKYCKTECKIILCTTTNTCDDILIEIAQAHNILYFRGSENDKLLRWYDAAKKYNIDKIVTVDGDDIFAEPMLIDKAFEQLKNKDIDFIKGDHTGLICGSFTYGFTINSLERVCELKDTTNTEMMWVYFTDTGLFNICELQDVPISFYRNDIRMTLDYEEDLFFFNTVIENSEQHNEYLDLEQIINIIDNNQYIKHINFFRQEQWKENQDKNTTLCLKNKKKFCGNELKYMTEIITNSNLSCTSGSWTKSIEQYFSEKIGCKYSIAFNSGTSTLHAALLAVGVGPGDEVISPAFTVIMNTSTTIHANAIPVYVDIHPETFCIDAAKIEEKITSKTKAIVIVSMYGLPCDMDPIIHISKKYNIPIIEDDAECVLGTYCGKNAGSIADISSFSFENSKHISCGEGGMLTTNNEKYAVACRKIGCHGFKNLQAGSGTIKTNKDIWQNPQYERHDEIGWNYRLPEINSGLVYAQLERLEEIVDLRVKSAEIFLEIIKDCSYLVPQTTPHNRTNAYWSLGVIYNGHELINVSWEDFRKKYIEFGGDGIYGAWKVPYLEPVMKNRNFVKLNPLVYNDVFYSEGLCPIAENIQKKLMVFKTNYRNLDLAKYKAYCLKKTIEYFENNKFIQ